MTRSGLKMWIRPTSPAAMSLDGQYRVPPIYFHLPDHAIVQYWNDISSAAPNTDFVIYNIPQLAGVALSIPLYEEMLKNPRVIGVKNSSMPVQDIQMFKDIKGDDSIVFNGPDEQFIAGRMIGGVRKPLPSVIPEDMPKIEACYEMLQKGIAEL